MSEKKARIRDLRRRRDELADSLAALEKTRADTVQQHSYSRARDRAGVTGGDTADETARLGADEDAAHAALRDVRMEMHRIDAEIESEQRDGSGSRIGRVLGRVRRRGG
jgi:hypothetical protein